MGSVVTGRRVWLDPRRRATVLTALLVALAFCAVFFIADVVADVRLLGWLPHTVFEGMVTAALVTGVALSAVELRRVVADMRRAEIAVSSASGALGSVIVERFAEWGLTASEADVALFALKGFDIAEIAKLRGAAAGTVRAQLARVYAKAGVSNRAGLVALFIEDLLEGVQLPGQTTGSESVTSAPARTAV